MISQDHAPVQSPLDITEILQSIAAMLDPVSLVAATLVSRQWHQCCSPLLWKTIRSSDWVNPRFSPRQLYQHAHLVRTLQWHSLYVASLHAAAAVDAAAGIYSMWGMTAPAPPLLPLSPALFDTKTASKTVISLNHHQSQADQVNAQMPEQRDEPVQDQLSLKCLNRIVAACHNLQKLCLHAERQGIHHDMVEAIQSLEMLQSLELYAHRIVVGHGDTAKTTTRLLNVQNLVSCSPQLKTLILRGNAFRLESLLVPPCNKSPDNINSNYDQHVQAISDVDHEGPCVRMASDDGSRPLIELAASTGPQESSAAWPRMSPRVQYPQPYQSTRCFPIQHLSLDLFISEKELALLLSQCPALESLDLPGGLVWEISDPFLAGFAQSCPRLSAFSINSSCNAPVPEDRLSALVLTLPPLRRFSARSCLFGDLVLDALEARCPGLQELDISLTRGHQLTKTRLYEYLRHAEGLKKLEADGVWIPMQDLQGVQIDAQSQQQQGQGFTQVQQQHGDSLAMQEMVPLSSATSISTTVAPDRISTCSGWASRDTLHHLTIGFTSPDRSIEPCHAMYSLLSTLSQLQHLQLSYTCLDLSPRSGFRRLETLTELRTFSIETCGYGALMEEDLMWMVGAWPKLERIFVNMLGASKARQCKAWLKNVGREDVIIKSQQSVLY
ncbi:hypothetical protein EDD11_006791 [Mortierella claussenii]|nr:hypothetical protein EDD11_006791 [Mortierella claussenii]